MVDTKPDTQEDALQDLWEREQRTTRMKRAIRWSIAIILILSAVPIFGVLAPFVTALGVVLFAPDIAHYLSGFADRILWNRDPGVPTPIYGIPESLVAKGLYAEAEKEYDKIIQEFPNEAKPHIGLIEIAVKRLNNATLAESLYTRGLSMLQDPNQQEILKAAYERIRTRLKDPTPKEPARVAFHKAPKYNYRD